MRQATSRSSKWSNGWRNRRAEFRSLGLATDCWCLNSASCSSSQRGPASQFTKYRVQFSVRRKTIMMTKVCLLLHIWWINWYVRYNMPRPHPPSPNDGYPTSWCYETYAVEKRHQKFLRTVREPISPAWLLMTHRNVFSKLPIPESRDLDLGKNVVCRPISLFF